jgi:Na+/citrate or Na+/malate symporter
MGFKADALVVGMAATMLAAKIESKLTVKLIPIIGGLVGAGIKDLSNLAAQGDTENRSVRPLP